jgi:hypothetical protein
MDQSNEGDLAETSRYDNSFPLIPTSGMSGEPGGVDSGVIEETARLNESYTPIPLKHLASRQIEGSR